MPLTNYDYLEPSWHSDLRNKELTYKRKAILQATVTKSQNCTAEKTLEESKQTNEV